MPSMRTALNGTLDASVIADETGNEVAALAFQPLQVTAPPTTFAEAIDWSPIVPEQWGCVADVYASDGSINPNPTDNTVNLNKANDALRTGQALNFQGGYGHTGEFELKGGKGYTGQNQVYSGLYLLNGSNKNLAVSDRWLRSDPNLNERVLIHNIGFNGNKASNAAGNALLLCNFRPLVNNILVRNAAEDNIHMPYQLKDGTIFEGNAVGGMLTNVRSEGCAGRHLYAAGGSDMEKTTFTDTWCTNWSIGTGGTYGMYVEPASGWFVQNVHCSGLTASNSLYFYGASTLWVDNIYLENFGTADLTANRYAVRVAKVKAGAGVFITNVGGNVTTAPNTNVIQCMVSVEGGASPGQFAHLDHIHMDSLSGHNYNLGINASCASGGTLTIDYGNITMTNFTRAVRSSGSGTTIFRDRETNSWNYGTAIPGSTTNGSWSAGTIIKNTDAANEIDKFICLTNGNPGTWRTLYRNGPLSGVVAPATAPSYVGQFYTDTFAKKGYIATGTASSADWTILN